jgi:hypothetical protein
MITGEQSRLSEGMNELSTVKQAILENTDLKKSVREGRNIGACQRA